jgi:cell division protein FtsA
MAREMIITGVDIGNQKIRTVVSVLEPDKKEAHIIGIGISPSLGLRKGVVVDAEELTSNISASLEDAERMSGIPINHVFVGVGGTHLEFMESKGIVAIGNKEITENDVERAREAAEALSLPQNRYRLRTLSGGYAVDDQGGIKNPVGLSGIRLEIDAHIISGQKQIVENIERTVQQSGVDVDDLVPGFLAVSEAVLSRRQKELGVVLIDIGADCTNVVVHEEGVILHSSIIPVGGGSVTNDIAIGLRTSIDAAEKIKIEYGTTIPEEVREIETIDLSLLSKIDSQKVSKKHLAEIIQARYHEIFSMAKRELKNIHRDGMLPAGVILTGAAVKMSGVVDIARDILGLPVQIGFPQGISGVVDKIDDPAFATATGLIIWGTKHEPTQYGLRMPSFEKTLAGIGGFFRKLLP